MGETSLRYERVGPNKVKVIAEKNGEITETLIHVVTAGSYKKCGESSKPTEKNGAEGEDDISSQQK